MLKCNGSALQIVTFDYSASSARFQRICAQKSSKGSDVKVLKTRSYFDCSRARSELR